VLSVLEVGSAAVDVGTAEVGAIEIGPVEIGNARIATETPPRVESLGIVEIAPRADHGEPAAAAGNSPFRPLLQVDSFAWPTVCTDLHAAAGVELDQLAAGVMTEGGRRRKVVAMGSIIPGEGCTTMLLCAARRLARRGLNVVIVDADLADPRLAGRLGLVPESGWEEVAAGRASPADVLIESIEDRITLLPLQGQPSPAGRTILDDPSLLGGLALELLRQHYDLVLIDVGALGNVAGNPPQSRTAGNWIDAAVIVQDIRSTARDGVARVRSYLDAVGIPLAGVAENFVHA
jgi:Mrp family chromosome partitioning ATPase